MNNHSVSSQDLQMELRRRDALPLVAMDLIALTVLHEQSFGLPSPNGSGKTTSVNPLCAVRQLRPTTPSESSQ